MIERIQLFFKDQNNLARAATICFFIAVGIAAILLIRLPHDLVYKGGMIDSGRATAVFAKLFVVIALVFGFCYALIFFSQKIKKETIVYLDKKAGETSETQTFAGSSSHSSSTLNLNSLRDKIKNGNTDERFQNGLNELCHQLNAGQGALYTVKKQGESKLLSLKSGFALVLAEGESMPEYNWGEGLIGQTAASGASQYIDEMPEGYAARIESGLGNALPKFLFIFPLKKETETVGVVEVATFTALSDDVRKQTIEAGKILAELC